MMTKKKIAVLLSGDGSTFQSLADYQINAHYEIVGVISNCPNAYGIERAKNAEIFYKIINHTLYSDRQEFEKAIIKVLHSLNPDFIVLSGFMRILTPVFINFYHNKIINIHPSLLPKYKGLNTHKKALNNKDKYHGTTIHVVSEKLDDGINLLQGYLKINPHETIDSLTTRIKKMEQILYPYAIDLLSTERLTIQYSSAFLDQKKLPSYGLKIKENKN